MTNEPNANKPNFVRLDLTEDQRAQVRASLGIDVNSVELSARELEERVAPLNYSKISLE